MTPIWNLIDEKVIKSPAKLTDVQIAELKERWQALNSGPYSAESRCWIPAGRRDSISMLWVLCLACVFLGIVIGAAFDEAAMRWLGW